MHLHQVQHFIDLRELSYFVAVAEELHFTRAAERIGINQSPLSKAITIMERNLGVRLFVRTRKSTRLTAVGKALLLDARRILAEVERARQNIKSVASGQKGQLRVALSDGLGVPRIARVLAQARDEDPEVEFSITQTSATEQLRALRSDAIDIGISTAFASGPAERPSKVESHDVVAVALWRDPVALAMHPDHPLSAQSIVRTLDGGLGPYILVGDVAAACASVEELRHLRSTKPHALESVTSFELLLTRASAGFGVGLIGAEQTKAIARQDLTFRPFGSRRVTMATYLLRRRDDQSPLVARFIERAKGLVSKPHSGYPN